MVIMGCPRRKINFVVIDTTFPLIYLAVTKKIEKHTRNEFVVGCCCINKGVFTSVVTVTNQRAVFRRRDRNGPIR